MMTTKYNKEQTTTSFENQIQNVSCWQIFIWKSQLSWTSSHYSEKKFWLYISIIHIVFQGNFDTCIDKLIRINRLYGKLVQHCVTNGTQLQWRHNERDGVSNHQPHPRWIPSPPMNSPHKWPVARRMFPFDDVIMRIVSYTAWLQ